MAKKPLPGWAFMIAGVILVLYSNYIEKKVPDANLVIFFWTGLLFVFLGLVKEIKLRVIDSKPVEKPAPVGPPPQQQQRVNDHRHPAGNQFQGQSNHQQHIHTRPHPHVQHPHTPPLKQCPQCSTGTPLHSKYCHNCGWQFY
ncbi:hypothetical protein GOV11_05195 [Candidatus Woesearchaeota archaeon]|nr:hypothetical protein [Candidatus Woesearchaeota archaeon]